MKQVTIFGVANCRFGVDNPRGQATYYPTRRERDASRAALIERAEAAGLSDPEENFRAVFRVVRSDAAHSWLAALRAREILRGEGEGDAIWGPAVAPFDED